MIFPDVMLPNGMKISCLQKQEALFVYQQVPSYFKHGIEVQAGDTVFDLGANIGLFTLSVYERCRGNVVVYAFEPIPTTFEVLQRNAQRYDSKKLKVFPCGVSKTCGTMTFAYYPSSSVFSTAYPDDLQEERDRLKRAVLDNPNADGTPLFFRWLPSFLRPLILDIGLKVGLRREMVVCQVVTLSSIIRTHSIERIDLLKVDTERSELDVFLGIEDQDWPKIKQVVVEVHETGHLLEPIIALLREHGLSEFKVEQEATQEQLNTMLLYAVRPKI